jgi:hypothetical protein
VSVINRLYTFAKFFMWRRRFFLGIGIGAEYPCGSVAASEQSEEKEIAKNAQHRWFALATSTNSRSFRETFADGLSRFND